MLRRIFRGKIRLMHFIHAFILAFFLIACGDDNGSSPAPDDLSSSSKPVILSSNEGSSNGKSSSSVPGTKSSGSAKSSSSKNGDAGTRSSSSGQAPAGMTSSSVTPKSSSSDGKKIASSFSTPRNDVSSSSEYVPFDHSQTLAGAYKVGENAYKQFTDTRNGRSYYYITITSDYTGKSVTVMAENLNIGKMVPGAENQNDDNEIERYCYNNDTTKCDEFGGLYQWAEMMQLPSRCNTESCSDLIQENHQGICPDDWRLMTYNDFFIAWHAETNEYGIEGVRSMYGFNGYNSSGLSLVDAGLTTKKGEFSKLNQTIFFAYPQEHVVDSVSYVYSSYISGITDHAPRSDDGDLKIDGYSVRCVMVE